jgi:ubiquinone biosynthesis protein
MTSMLARVRTDEGTADGRLGSGRSARRPPSGPRFVWTPLRFGRWLLRCAKLSALTVAYAPPLLVATALGLESGPRWLRSYLQASGGLFVKLGQILALRYDLLPERYCRELAKLLDALPPVPTRVIRRTIEADLGRPVDKLFARFDETPLSCASVAQVHGAMLPSGESVVVKVVRPGSEAAFRGDLWLVEAGATLLELIGVGVRVGLRRVARELEAFTREEFDLVRELRNAELLEESMRGDGLAHAVPNTYPELSSRSVLTMQRIVGITVAELIAAREAGGPDADERLSDWRREGIEAGAVSRLLLRSMLVQMLRHRTFHADPHSANILVCPGGTLVFVDFGIFGWLDERQWAQQMRMRHALAAGKVHAAYTALVADFVFPAGMDVAAFETEMKEILWRWGQASRSPHATIQEKSAGALFLRVFDAVRRAGASIPSGLLRFFRALVVSDMVILKLDPDIDILAEVRAFLEEETTRLTVKTTARGAASAPATLVRLAAEAPEVALEALEWLADAPGTLRAPHASAPPSTSAPLLRVLFSVGSLIALAFTLVAAARPWLGGVAPVDALASSFGIDLAKHTGVGVGVGLGSFLLLRRLRAAVAR